MRGSSARLKAVTLRAASWDTASRSADGWNSATSALPSRHNRASWAEGGCTLSTMSLCPNISAAVAAGVAPAAAYASSPNDAASPALRSTTTDKPAFTSRPATSGVKATRRSLAAVSFGTPMFMNPRSGIVNDNVIRRPLSVIRGPPGTTDDGQRMTS